MKKLLLAFFILITSISVQANCLPVYKEKLKGQIAPTVALGVSIAFLPVALAFSYDIYQAKKMAKLIKEAENKNVHGKITIGLFKSLKGEFSRAELQQKIRTGNKEKKFCLKYAFGLGVSLYRQVKDELRYIIDMKRLKEGKEPLWP